MERKFVNSIVQLTFDKFVDSVNMVSRCSFMGSAYVAAGLAILFGPSNDNWNYLASVIFFSSGVHLLWNAYKITEEISKGMREFFLGQDELFSAALILEEERKKNRRL